MKSIVEKSLLNGISYSNYRKHIKSLLIQGKSTGKEQSEALTHYSELNEARMNRLEKTVKISTEIIQKLNQINGDYIWLVISEGWCGDAAQILPVIYKMAELSEKIDLKIVFRDENDDLMNLFLTNGTKSIPKLIILDKNTLEVLGDYGPRPIGANQFMLDYKKEFGMIDEKAKSELQMWYFKDKGLSIQNEILELLLINE
jgi:hypothetical protein